MANTLKMRITTASVLRFALPSIIMMVVMSLYTVVDGVFVAALIGTDAFSAVNIMYPLFSIVIALGTMFGTGAVALVARKLGEGKQREANQNLTFIVLVSIALGAAISLVSFVFLERIILILGADRDTFRYCYEYAFPLLLFLPASILQLAFQYFFVANGKPNIGLITTVAGGLANIVLDYVFIKFFHMGISGAAVATGIGYCIPSFYGIWFFTVKRKADLHFVWPRIDCRALAEAVINGSSEMVNYISTSVTTFLFNIIMMGFAGSDGVAAIAVLLYLDFVLIAVSLGYSLGVAPLFSFNYGSADTGKLRELFRISILFCVVVGIGVTAGTMFFSGALTAVFAPRDSEVYLLAEAGLRIFAVGYLFKGFNVFASALFTALSNGLISAVISFMRTLVFLAASLLGLTAIFGLKGVWYASPVAEGLAFILSLFLVERFRRKYHYA